MVRPLWKSVALSFRSGIHGHGFDSICASHCGDAVSINSWLILGRTELPRDCERSSIYKMRVIWRNREKREQNGDHGRDLKHTWDRDASLRCTPCCHFPCSLWNSGWERYCSDLCPGSPNESTRFLSEISPLYRYNWFRGIVALCSDANHQFVAISEEGALRSVVRRCEETAGDLPREERSRIYSEFNHSCIYEVKFQISSSRPFHKCIQISKPG